MTKQIAARMSLLYLFTAFVFMRFASADILVIPIDGRFIEEEFRDMPSTFGNGLPYDGLRGMVIYGQPADACTPLKKAPPFGENRTGKWIVLVARYNCSFELKVRNAQDALYDGVIVHNVRSDVLEPMSAKNSSGIHIPSVFVSESTGRILKDVYADNVDYFVIINSEMPFNINSHLLLPFAIVVGICFLVMVFFMIVKFVRDRRRQRRDRLSSSALTKIPTSKFQKGDPYETCAICLDDYVEGEKLRILPCAHAYHSKCIDPWLTKSRRVCPVCKRKVFAHDETPYADTDSDTDTDDTTPLLRGGAAGNRTQGGTFVDVYHQQAPEQHQQQQQQQRGGFFRRALRSLSQQSEAANFVTTSDQHSINGGDEQSSSGGEEHSAEYYSTDTTNDEVQTRPSTSEQHHHNTVII